jgi:hypothetical protein
MLCVAHIVTGPARADGRAIDGWARTRTRAAVEHHSLLPTADPVATLFRLRATLCGGMGQLITGWTRDFQELLLLSPEKGYRSGLGRPLSSADRIFEFYGSQIDEFPPDGNTRTVVCIPTTEYHRKCPRTDLLRRATKVAKAPAHCGDSSGVRLK